MSNYNLSEENNKIIDGLSKTSASIGSSVSIKGEITGAEDIIIHGKVEGTINLKKNVVMVAKTGHVNANIYGQIIHVEGEVVGDLFGTEQIVLHKSGNIKGNISAPRISIEDGARIKGAIDTDVKSDSAIVLKDAESIKTGKKEETIIAEGFTPSSNGKSGASARA